MRGIENMTSYCEICGEELTPEEEDEEICQNCKISKIQDHNDKEKDDYDPGIT